MMRIGETLICSLVLHVSKLSVNFQRSFEPPSACWPILRIKVAYKTYMLFAGWEVCIVKNRDRGLENAALGRSIFKAEVTVFHYTDRP